MLLAFGVLGVCAGCAEDSRTQPPSGVVQFDPAEVGLQRPEPPDDGVAWGDDVPTGGRRPSPAVDAGTEVDSGPSSGPQRLVDGLESNNTPNAVFVHDGTDPDPGKTIVGLRVMPDDWNDVRSGTYLVAMRNDFPNTHCSFLIDLTFKDASGAVLFESSPVFDLHEYVPSTGDYTVNCVGPGDVFYAEGLFFDDAAPKLSPDDVAVVFWTGNEDAVGEGIANGHVNAGAFYGKNLFLKNLGVMLEVGVAARTRRGRGGNDSRVAISISNLLRRAK